MPQPPNSRAEPKRNSGRTGRRRLTAAEAALNGPKAAYEHRRLYSDQGPRQPLPTLGEPPAWFSPALADIWNGILTAAPPGLLAAIDTDNLISYCAAVDSHRRLAQAAAVLQPGELLPERLERRLRVAGAAVAQAAKALALQPYDRNRLVLPAPAPEPGSAIIPEGLRHLIVLPGGRGK